MTANGERRDNEEAPATGGLSGWDTCYVCGGHGLVMDGLDVADCDTCGGGGIVPPRDERGRFLPWDLSRIPVPVEPVGGN